MTMHTTPFRSLPADPAWGLGRVMHGVCAVSIKQRPGAGGVPPLDAGYVCVWMVWMGPFDSP